MVITKFFSLSCAHALNNERSMALGHLERDLALRNYLEILDQISMTKKSPRRRISHLNFQVLAVSWAFAQLLLIAPYLTLMKMISHY